MNFEGRNALCNMILGKIPSTDELELTVLGKKTSNLIPSAYDCCPKGVKELKAVTKQSLLLQFLKKL